MSLSVVGQKSTGSAKCVEEEQSTLLTKWVTPGSETPKMDIKMLYGNILGIRNKLMKMVDDSIPHCMDDLRKYQQMLDKFDSSRVNGIFGGKLEQGLIPAGQSACLEVLDDAYDLLEDLIESAHSLNPSIETILSNLHGIARRLDKFRNSDHTWEDLRYYEQMLNAIDRERVDGIFCGSPQTQVPEGQGTCSDLLAKCYDTLEELKATSQNMKPHVLQLHDWLVEIKEYLSDMKKFPDLHDMSEVIEVDDEMDFIEQCKVDGVYGGDRAHPYAGQNILHRLVKENQKSIRRMARYYCSVASYGHKERIVKEGWNLPKSERPEEWKQMDRQMRFFYRSLVSIRNYVQRVDENGLTIDPEDIKWYQMKLQLFDSQRIRAVGPFKSKKHRRPAGTISCRQIIEEASEILTRVAHRSLCIGDAAWDELGSQSHLQLAKIGRKLNRIFDCGLPTKEEVVQIQQMLSDVGTPLSQTAPVMKCTLPMDEFACCTNMFSICSLDVLMNAAVDMDPSLQQLFQRLQTLRDIILPEKITTSSSVETIAEEMDEIKGSKILQGSHVPGAELVEDMIEDCCSLLSNMST